MTPQPTPEQPAQGGEQLNAPQPSVPPQGAPAPAGQPAPVPVIPDVPDPATPAADPGVQVTNPALAADVDVIEKEWVDKAEQAIRQTEGNPHAEEEAVEDLQIDYMKKRYGKDVRKSDD